MVLRVIGDRDSDRGRRCINYFAEDGSRKIGPTFSLEGLIRKMPAERQSIIEQAASVLARLVEGDPYRPLLERAIDRAKQAYIGPKQ